ncbi:MAG: hypothetical protein J6W00_03505 [Lentisphaeria bacterium]|nr:hypothetical protein [Lentisphaeria bacterium]
MYCIQNEIDKCAASGGGKVIVPAGEYHSGTIYLRSNVTLHLSEGALICGSENLDDYPAPQDKFSDGAAQERGRALILAENITNSAVEGSGTISGSGKSFPTDGELFQYRPMLIRFVNSSNIRLEGISLRDPAAWTCHLRGCRNVKITGLNIFSHANSNNDGIDIDSCSDVEVSFCNVDSGDDAVCLKSTLDRPCENICIHDCKLRSLASAFKIGTETYGNVRQVVFRDNCILDGEMGAMKIYSADGAEVEDIAISNIEIKSATNPLFIRLGERGNVYGDFPVKKSGSIKKITVDGLRGNIRHHSSPVRAGHLPVEGVPVFSHNCLSIMGLPDNEVESISLKNIVLTLPGGADHPGWDETPERADGYPELGYYGILPAYGIYMRHVKKIDFSGYSSFLSTHDVRKEIILEDVHEVNGI